VYSFQLVQMDRINQLSIEAIQSCTAVMAGCVLLQDARGNDATKENALRQLVELGTQLLEASSQSGVLSILNSIKWFLSSCPSLWSSEVQWTLMNFYVQVIDSPLFGSRVFNGIVEGMANIKFSAKFSLEPLFNSRILTYVFNLWNHLRKEEKFRGSECLAILMCKLSEVENRLFNSDLLNACQISPLVQILRLKNSESSSWVCKTLENLSRLNLELFTHQISPNLQSDLNYFCQIYLQWKWRKTCADLRTVVYRLENFVPSARFEQTVQYYSKNIVNVIGTELGEDVLGLISEMATEGYFIGQQIDLQEKLNQEWCAAEVIEVEYNKIKVHYIGWMDRSDEWIYIPSERVTLAFANTIAEQPANTEIVFRQISMTQAELCLAEPSLGISSFAELEDEFRKCHFNLQRTINSLRFKQLNLKMSEFASRPKRRRTTDLDDDTSSVSKRARS
jgi:hypothetical protein